MTGNTDTADTGRLLDGLREARSRLILSRLLNTALWCAAFCGFGAVALYVLEVSIYVPALWRIVILAACVLVLGGIALSGTIGAFLSYGSLKKTARALDSSDPALRNRLENALGLIGHTDSRRGYSPDLVKGAIAQAAIIAGDRTRMRGLAYTILQRYRRFRRAACYAAFSGLGLMFIITLTNPAEVSLLLGNYGSPVELLRKERSFRIMVRPGDTTLLRTDSLTISAVGTIHRPGGMTVHFWQAGSGASSQTMRYDPEQFEHTCTFSSVDNDLSYYVSQGNTVTDTFRVTVTNNPFITELSLRYEYPAYSGLPAWETTRERAIEALRGTRVILEGRSSNPLVRARITLGPDSVRLATLNGERGFTDTIRVLSNGTYSIRLEDTWGLANADTLAYPVRVQEDEQPAVVIRHPAPQADITEQMKQPLIFELADDFGLGRLVLTWRKLRAAGDTLEPRSRTIRHWSSARTYIMDQYLWDLGDIDMLPRDQVLYRLTVYDNDLVSGPKSASTPFYRLRFPSLEELFTREQQHQEEIVTDLQELEQQGEQLKEQVRSMKEEIERGEQLDWEKGRRLEQAAARQKEMLEQVSQLAGELEKSVSQMERSGMMSAEIMEKLARVQQAMEEVATDRMKQAMQKLQEAVKNLDEQQVQKALEEFQFSQEEILDKLDKTLALLEQMKLEQEMDYLTGLAEELASEAAELTDSTRGAFGENSQPASADTSLAENESSGAENGKAGEESAEAERDSGESGSEQEGRETSAEKQAPREKLEQLARQSEELAGKTEEMFEKAQETSEALEKAGEEELAGRMGEESGEQNRSFLLENFSSLSSGLRTGKSGQSVSSGEKISQRMKEMAERFEQMREQMKEQKQKEVAEAMERAFDELGYLSARQEDIHASVIEEPDINHPDVLGFAARQRDITEGLETIRDGLVQAARDNFFISEELLLYLNAALARSEGSLDALQAERRNRDLAEKNSRDALATINASMLTLIQDRRNMQASSSMTGMDQMISQLEAMAEQQRQLNEKMEGMQQNRGDGRQGQAGRQPRTMPGPAQQPGMSGPTMEGMMEMLRQMAAEQQAIRDQAARLAEQMEGRKDMPGSGSLEGVIKDADEVIKDLRERGVSQETLERQNRIFNRLMDAQKSIQERESGKKRKSERPEDFTVEPPAPLAEKLLESNRREGRLESLLDRWKGTYPSSYESMVRDYFERLKARELEN